MCLAFCSCIVASNIFNGSKLSVNFEPVRFKIETSSMFAMLNVSNREKTIFLKQGLSRFLICFFSGEKPLLSYVLSGKQYLKLYHIHMENIIRHESRLFISRFHQFYCVQ